METVKPILRLAWYVAKKRHSQFEWGKNDCNTFVVEMHDYVWGTDYLPRLYGKYSSLLSAARFSRRDIQAPDWLTEAGYRKSLHRTDHSVLLEQRGSCWHAWVVLQGQAYSIDPEKGAVVAPAPAVENVEVWSYYA